MIWWNRQLNCWTTKANSRVQGFCGYWYTLKKGRKKANCLTLGGRRDEKPWERTTREKGRKTEEITRNLETEGMFTGSPIQILTLSNRLYFQHRNKTCFLLRGEHFSMCDRLPLRFTLFVNNISEIHRFICAVHGLFLQVQCLLAFLNTSLLKNFAALL